MLDVTGLLEQFTDPREDNKVTYPLLSLLFMSICGVCSGAETWGQIVTWAETHQSWLHRYVDMSQGIPSYSTIRRLFILVKPDDFQGLLQDIIDSLHPNKKPEDHVAIDGKALRGSRCHIKKVKAMQIVTALSIENRFSLAAVKTNSKSNEITSIPVLLALLELEGATVSVDAIGCNDTVINAILAQGAHYMIGLNKNQPTLYEAVVAYANEKGTHLKHLVSDGFDKGHGRCVRRRYFAFSLPENLCASRMTSIKTCIAVERISSSKHSNTVTSHGHYYITDHNADHPKLASYIRQHWEIESHHWLLDVHLNDDNDKKYEANSAENFARMRRFLLDLVKSKKWPGKKEH
ncbi:MAG: ISAs1 family transposase [Rhizobiales bacterium]|nr:ISAs1 family transposase [Hyphomicrobiales bacterium]